MNYRHSNSGGLLAAVVFLSIVLVPHVSSAQDSFAPFAALVPSSQDQAMSRGDAARSQVLSTNGPEKSPQELVWKSQELFRLRGGDATFQMGPSFPVVTIDLPPQFDLTNPIIADGVVFFTLDIRHGYFYALDAATGQQLIVLKFDETSLSPPAALGKTAFFGTSSGRIYAYDVQAKRVSWSYQEKDRLFTRAPAIDDGMVYFSASKGGLYAFVASTGELKWIFKSNDFLYAPAIASDKVILLNGTGTLIVVDKNTGTKAWEAKVDRDTTSPSIHREHIVLVHARGEIQARSMTDGSLQWRSKKYGGSSGVTALFNGKVFYGGREDSIVALDIETGDEKWRFKTNRPCRSPVIAGDTIYSSCLDRKIYALDVETGVEKWRYDNKKGTAPIPTFANGIMYALGTDGYLYAVK